MQYSHTQKAPLYLLLLAIAAWVGTFAVLFAGEAAVAALLGMLTLMFAALGLSFAWLRIEDEGQRLLVRYGPLPFFWRRVEYSEIKAIRRGRSTWADGWGIHWAPGRGCTYNLWGFDCVELQLEKSKLRLGTDDAENLAAFLSSKIEKYRGAPG